MSAVSYRIRLPVEVYRKGLFMLAKSYDALSNQAGWALAACELRAKEAKLEANLDAEALALRLAQNQVGLFSCLDS